MAATLELERLIIRIVGDASQYLNTLDRAAAQSRAAAERLGNIGRQMTYAVTAPLIALGTTAVREFAEFEMGLAKIEGLVGIPGDAVHRLGQEVIGLATEVGKTPDELASALYFITSSGFEANEAMDVLRVSAKAATAGLGETQVVANAITTVMNAYGHSAISATRATDILVAAVREGKAEGTDFAVSLGRVIPIAAQLGIPFEQVAGAMAGLTLTGARPTTSAIELAQIFSTLLGPTQEARRALASVGLTAEGLRDQMKVEGVIPTLNAISDAFGGNIEQIEKVFGNIRALRGALSLIGPNMVRNRQIIDELSGALGDTDRAFQVVTRTVLFAWRRAMVMVNIALIHLGEILRPLAEFIIFAIGKAVTAWEGFSAETKRTITIVATLTAVVGPLLLLLGYLGPVFMVGANILGKITGIILTVTAVFGRFGIISSLITLFSAWLPIILGVAAAVATFIAYFGGLEGAKQALMDFGRLLLVIWEGIKEGVRALIPIVTSFLRELWEGFLGFVQQNQETIRLIFVMALAIGGAVVAFKGLVLVISLVVSVLTILRVHQVISLTIWLLWKAAIILLTTVMVTFAVSLFLVEAAIIAAEYLFIVVEVATMAWAAACMVLDFTLGLIYAAITSVKVATFATNVVMAVARAGQIIWNALLAASIALWGLLAGRLTFATAAMIIWKSIVAVGAFVLGVFNSAVAGAILLIKSMNVLAVMSTVGIGVWSAALLVGKGIVWLVNAALAVFNALIGPTALIAAIVTIGLLATVFVAVGAAVWGVWQAAVALFNALANIPTTSGPLSAISALFVEWFNIIKLVIRAAKVDMPLAWEFLKAGFMLAVVQVKALWPPLWDYLKRGFSAVATLVSAVFKFSFLEALGNVAAAIGDFYDSTLMRLVAPFAAPLGRPMAIFGRQLATGAVTGRQMAITQADFDMTAAGQLFTQGYIADTPEVRAARQEIERLTRRLEELERQRAVAGGPAVEEDIRRTRQEIDRLNATNIAPNTTGLDTARAKLEQFDAVLISSAEAYARIAAFRTGEAYRQSARAVAADQVNPGVGVPARNFGPNDPTRDRVVALLEEANRHLAVLSAKAGGGPGIFPADLPGA